MLTIYRIDHVAQVVPDLESQVQWLERLLGFRPVRSWASVDEGCAGVRLDVPGSWGQRWEVLAPLGEKSAIGEFLERRNGRPGLHHVAVEVPDLAAAMAELERHGIAVTRGPESRWIEASLSPPELGPGVLFRLRAGGARDWCGAGEGDPWRAVAQSEESSLGIVAIDHVCQAFRDRDELARWYEDLAGFVPVWRTPLEEHSDMADLVMNVPGSNLSWEIIMPRGPDSFIERFWSKQGAAAHHVTFEVSDWERAMEACRRSDVPTFGENEGKTDGARWRDAFIHPKHTGGVLMQFFWEERPGVWVRSDKIPFHDAENKESS